MIYVETPTNPALHIALRHAYITRGST